MVGSWLGGIFLGRGNRNSPTNGEGRSTAPANLLAAYTVRPLLSGEERVVFTGPANAYELEIGIVQCI